MQLTLHAPTQEAGHLVIPYEACNPANEPIYLRICLRDYYGEADPLENDPTLVEGLAQVAVLGSDVALFWLGESRIPDSDVLAGAARVPYSRRLEARASHRGSVRVKEPLAEWSCYDPPRRDGADLITCRIRQIVVAIEYATESTLAFRHRSKGLPPEVYMVGAAECAVATASLDVTPMEIRLLHRPDFCGLGASAVDRVMAEIQR